MEARMFKPLILMPSYNTGRILLSTVSDVLARTQQPLLVVIDGSDDGSDVEVLALADREVRLTVINKPINEGKGADVRSGLLAVRELGYSHVLVIDADGQHPVEMIDAFMAQAKTHPKAIILGQPIFDENVPVERLYGRKLTVWLVQFEVMSRAIGDPLFGFRVYPVEPLLNVLSNPTRSNRYDFDPEVVVRLSWNGIPAVKAPAPVKYLDLVSGGVSHFHYLRDNVRYVGLHTKLIIEMPFRLIGRLIAARSQRSR
jgi:glycosyltransferase involved in cell wall biosynthesis